MTSNCFLRSIRACVCVAASFYFCVTAPAWAKPKMVTTTTDLAWLAQQIAGPDAEVESLLNGTEDPHFVDARPDYIRKVSSADAVCLVGLDLEIGWMPKVLAKSARKHLQAGGTGYCELGRRIEALEKPTGAIDRSRGDVHPNGNPHFWLSPAAMALAAAEVTETFERIDPAHAQGYRARQLDFTRSMQELESSILEKFKQAGVVGTTARFIEYHREFSYFARAFGLQSVASIEEKPGISPSAGRIAAVALQAKSQGIAFAIAAPHAPERLLTRFEELSGVNVVKVPISIKKQEAPQDYPALLTAIQIAIVNAAKGSQQK